MTRDDFRRQADVVRSIPLPTVLMRWGAERDRRDRSRWQTQHGPLSVTGAKFFNWHRQEGGGGAIDLVMHLSGWDARTAIRWLQQHLDSVPAAAASNATNLRPTPSSATSSSSSELVTAGQRRSVTHRQFSLPLADPAKLPRVHRYLTEQRSLATDILLPLIAEGRVYADCRGNAVLRMVAGKPNRAIGAELRGTGQRVWRGLAPGTCKDAGYFWVGGVGAERIVLCESAIDAISCFQLQATQPNWLCICISTAGVRPDAPWLAPLIARGYDIYCGFDDDDPGNVASREMIRRHPSIKRLRPPAHDWNDALLQAK